MEKNKCQRQLGELNTSSLKTWTQYKEKRTFLNGQIYAQNYRSYTNQNLTVIMRVDSIAPFSKLFETGALTSL